MDWKLSVRTAFVMAAGGLLGYMAASGRLSLESPFAMLRIRRRSFCSPKD